LPVARRERVKKGEETASFQLESGKEPRTSGAPGSMEGLGPRETGGEGWYKSTLAMEKGGQKAKKERPEKKGNTVQIPISIKEKKKGEGGEFYYSSTLRVQSGKLEKSKEREGVRAPMPSSSKKKKRKGHLLSLHPTTRLKKEKKQLRKRKQKRKRSESHFFNANASSQKGREGKEGKKANGTLPKRSVDANLEEKSNFTGKKEKKGGICVTLKFRSLALRKRGKRPRINCNP